MGHAASAAGGCSSVGSWLCVGFSGSHPHPDFNYKKKGHLPWSAWLITSPPPAFRPAFFECWDSTDKRLSTFLPPARPPWAEWIVAQAQQQ